MEVTTRMAGDGHEQVVFFADPSVGLRMIVAVHSTALGPSLGGVRFWHYASDDEALDDALRLSRAMSLKASVAGLDQGGGKAVVLWDDPHRERDEEFRRAIGRAIHTLGGRYIAAEDVGATPADMGGIALETPWVTGVDPAIGGSGDPSPATAWGLFHAMQSVAAETLGSGSLAGLRVVVVGVGHVGGRLVEDLVGAGASVAVADIDDERVEAMVEAHGVDTVPAGAVLREPCDVLAPCALGGLLTVESVAGLRCRAICGAANNQLLDAAAGDALAARGILYAPDFVVNAGGVINVAMEWAPGGYSKAEATARAAGVGDVTARVLAAARERGVPPFRVAEHLAWERIQEEGSSRWWMPGDPAAWTAGEPLTHLRAPR